MVSILTILTIGLIIFAGFNLVLAFVPGEYLKILAIVIIIYVGICVVLTNLPSFRELIEGTVIFCLIRLVFLVLEPYIDKG